MPVANVTYGEDVDKSTISCTKNQEVAGYLLIIAAEHLYIA